MMPRYRAIRWQILGIDTMRKGTLLLSILLAVAVTSTVADAKKRHMKAAAAPAVAGYAWPGLPYQSYTIQQRDAFMRDALFPIGAK